MQVGYHFYYEPALSVCHPEFRDVANQSQAPAANRRRETADKVARVGLHALAAGKSYVISGTRNYLGAQVQRLVPRRLVTSIAAKLFRPAQEPG